MSGLTGVGNARLMLDGFDWSTNDVATAKAGKTTARRC